MAILNAVTSIGSGSQYVLNTGTDFRVAAGVRIISTANFAVMSDAADIIYDISGLLSGTNGGMLVRNTGASLGMAAITIRESGIVGGSFSTGHGLQVEVEALDLVNHGLIIGVAGLTVSGVNIDSDVTNHGDILAYGFHTPAVYVYADERGTAVLRNMGRIVGDEAYFSTTFSGLAIKDTIINKGKMFGSVVLGDGNDTCDTHLGQIKGAVQGEDGDDIYAPGRFVDDFDGGNDTDTVDFRAVAAVRVALDNSFAKSGAAAVGDSYSDVENLWGSGSGADRLRGNGAVNELRGNGGADTLEGAAGADRLVGGAGKDRLVGGAGADVFIFDKPGHGGDVITDFDVAGADQDRILIKSAGFDSALPDGALAAGRFRSRTDNAAQDADDRFIFRTTDKTLWFDADGRGGAGPTLVVDLANSVNLTAGHIMVDVL